jgi:hypothetical protein
MIRICITNFFSSLLGTVKNERQVTHYISEISGHTKQVSKDLDLVNKMLRSRKLRNDVTLRIGTAMGVIRYTR